MAVHSVSIHTDLGALLGDLQRSLQTTVNRVSLALVAVDVLREGDQSLPLDLPGASFPMRLAEDGNKRPVDKRVKEDFITWLLCSGLRDHVQALSQFLEKARRVCAFYYLNTLEQVTGEQWNARVIEEGKRFHRLGFPDKLDHLHKNYGLELDLSEHIKSINGARNCLEHRGGVVSERDTNEDNALVVRWRRFVLFAKGEQGDRQIDTLPAVFQKGDVIGVRLIDTSKAFQIGVSINFTAQEFSDLGLTSFLFGQDVVKKVEDYGRACGVAFREPSAPSLVPKKENDKQ